MKMFNKTFLIISLIAAVNINAAISENEFNDVLLKIKNLYFPIAKSEGNADLIFDANWADTKQNAFSTREEGKWVIHVAGGMARAKEMTISSFAFVVCHELGHQLGGVPKMSLYGGWPSAEGQADYWAGTKCLKKYFSTYDSAEIPTNVVIPDKVLNDCHSVFGNHVDQKLCIKTALAAIDFSKFLNSLANGKYVISLDTPDPKVVKGTNINDYPRPQCRLDTLYQGALCSVNFNSINSEKDPDIGNCNDYNKLGTRPACWFKPN